MNRSKHCSLASIAMLALVSATSSAPETDCDGDQIPDNQDNCPSIYNPSQADTGFPGTPADGIGDACDGPGDREGFYGPVISAGANGMLDTAAAGDDVSLPGNTVIWAGVNGTADTAAMGDDVQEAAVGAVAQDCDPVTPGIQGDGVADGMDNCPGVCNPDQTDTDGDGIGDDCCPPPPPPDCDGDQIPDGQDNCPSIYNPSQADTGAPGTPADGIGDACDGPGDREGFYGAVISAGANGVLDTTAAGDDVSLPGNTVIWAGVNGTADTTAMGDDVQEAAVGTLAQDCDPALPGIQGDGVPDGMDNCPGVCNPDQADTDGDGTGDACCPPMMAEAAGKVPDGASRPGEPLRVAPSSGGQIELSWGTSCAAWDHDYVVYEGSLGNFSSHVPIVCSTAGASSVVLLAPAGNAYYLIAPRNLQREGSLGLDSAGQERPIGLSSCYQQWLGACD